MLQQHQQRTEIQIFEFEGQPCRTANGDEGEILWHAGDVCRVLGLVGDPGQHLRRLEDDEKGVILIQTPGGPQTVLSVNESGLYTLILGSRKPDAARFRKWVTREVLPSIRQTGAYRVPQPVSQDPVLAQIEVLRELRQTQLRCEADVARAQATADTALDKAEAAMVVLTHDTRRTTLMGWCTTHGLSLPVRELASEGKRMSAACRARGVAIDQVHSQVFGRVNVYPNDLLEQWEAEYRTRATRN